MSQCVYLAASLPLLFFGDPPPYGPAAFRFHCQGVLDDADLRELDAVLAGTPGRSAFAAAWQARAIQLRNAVAHARAARLGVDARGVERPHAGYDVSVAQGVADAFAKADPLEREMDLDRLRWHILDELARQDPFGLPAILAFAVKLQLAARWAGMEKAAGQVAVEKVIDANDPGQAGAAAFRAQGAAPR